MEKIVIGSDHGGFRLKEKLKAFLEKKAAGLRMWSCFNEESCDYPEYAYAAAKGIAKGEFKRDPDL